MRGTTWIGWLILPALMAAVSIAPAHAQTKKRDAPATTKSEPSGIRWRLENPFRFFKNPAFTQRHRKAFVELEASLKRPPTISEVERHLALQTAGRGWAEAMVTSAAQEFCWWRHDRACEGYAHPKSHRVLVSIPAVTGTCEWKRDGAPVAGLAAAPCTNEVAIDVPYPQGARISASSEGRTVGETEIKVRDVLIVSMGDSFASGEGNPDKPVRFTRGRVINYGPEPTTMEGWDLGGYPAREGAVTNQGTSDSKYGAGNAAWLHRGCHRSLYSQHVRLALHVAISDPTQQRAVTYIGVACTGARVPYGLFGAWSGVTNALNTEWEVTLPQFSGVSRAICATAPQPAATPYALETPEDDLRPGSPPGHILVCPRDQARPIDLVLLSVGGNDVGFGRLVARASLKNDAILDTGAAFVGAKPKLTVREATSLLPKLESNYRQVARAIREVLYVDNPKQVLLTAYPPMAFDEHGQPCRADAPGMDVTPLFGIEPAAAVGAESFVERSLLPVMSSAARAAGWTYVDEQRAAYKGHGVCAVGGEPGDPAGAHLAMPRRRGDKPLEELARGPMGFGEAGAAAGRSISAGTVSTVSPSWRWLPYEPDRWRPYMPRNRWFRTPNDAFLTVNLHEASAGNEINLTRFAAYSGAFHPTAQGHAATADAVFRRVAALRLLD
jgi:hypothetical protein